MPEEQLKAFWEAVQADTSLQQELNDVTDIEAIAAIAKKAGFSISTDELRKAQSELSDERLEGTSGGFTGCSLACCGYDYKP